MGLTFDSMQEILHGMLVEPEGLLVVLGFILFCGFCHQINGFLERQNITQCFPRDPESPWVPGSRNTLLRDIARPGTLSVTDLYVGLLVQHQLERP